MPFPASLKGPEARVAIGFCRSPRLTGGNRMRGHGDRLGRHGPRLSSRRLCVPFDPDDIEDDRIYFSAPKINGGSNDAPAFWHRLFGTFFEHDPQTDPSSWGRDKSTEDLKQAFGTRPGMKRSELVKALQALGHDEATCYRATRSGGYLGRYLVEASGVLALRAP